MFTKYKIRHYNFKLLIMVIALAVIGIFAVGSAEPSLQSRQIGGFILGVVLMLVLSLFDYSVLLNLYWVMYVVNIALLLAVIFLWRRCKWCAEMAEKLRESSFSHPSLPKFSLFCSWHSLSRSIIKSLILFKMIFLCCVLFAVPTALVLKTARSFNHHRFCALCL